MTSEIKEKEENNKNGRQTKKQLYHKEQEEVLNRLNKILNITEKNNKFIYNNITEEQEKEILRLEEEVIKFYVSHNWTFFSNKRWLSLVKSIYKSMGYEVVQKNKQINKTKIKEIYINKKYLGNP